MTAAPQSTTAAETGETKTTAAPLLTALRNAFAAALVAFGLCFPIISYHAEANINNELVLMGRWPLSFGVAVLVFVVRLVPPDVAARLARLVRPGRFRRRRRLGRRARQSAREGEGVAPPSRARLSFSKWFGPFALGFVVLYPLIMLGLLGPAGSLKWINNYGVQIMIYVMLGWGLNIVVGLAGLLDLGYVAFYAVGAYSYALLSTTLRPVVLGVSAACRHPGRDVGSHPRLSGAAAARRLSRHRDAGLRRDHPARADQLGRFHQRLRGHLGHPARQLLRHPVHRRRQRLRSRSSICPIRRSTARFSFSTSSWRSPC